MMERFNKVFPIAGTVIAAVVAVIVAARQIGISQILVAIISTIITAVTLGVFFYLDYKRGKRHDSRDQHGRPEGK
jgi:putative effector of murein hydrolase LrgA (UPF0299 family)